MEEPLDELVQKCADFLHWLGKHREANALTMFARLLRAHALDTMDKLDRHVERLESCDEEAAVKSKDLDVALEVLQMVSECSKISFRVRGDESEEAVAMRLDFGDRDEWDTIAPKSVVTDGGVTNRLDAIRRAFQMSQGKYPF